jgi:hypothetical protein
VKDARLEVSVGDDPFEVRQNQMKKSRRRQKKTEAFNFYSSNFKTFLGFLQYVY